MSALWITGMLLNPSCSFLHYTFFKTLQALQNPALQSGDLSLFFKMIFLWHFLWHYLRLTGKEAERKHVEKDRYAPKSLPIVTMGYNYLR